MKKNNLGFAALLLVLLAVVVLVSLLFDRSGQETLQTPVFAEEYRLFFSEICTKNESVIPDNTGKYPDYVEIYNSGEAVSLAGLYLTDGKKSSEPFGDVTLGAGECRLVFLGDDTTGFALSASGGDCLQLKDALGRIVTQTNTTALSADQVMLYDNGSYVVSYDASPGFSNDEAGLAAFREGAPCQDAKLVINELLTQNVSTVPDEKGRYCDVVELYNASDSSVSLGGYCLSDSLAQRFRYRLPEGELAPDSCLLIFCDGENYIGESGEIHANFGLSYGETLCLTDAAGAYVTLEASFPGEDVSLARTLDGAYESALPTPGFSNDEAGRELFLQSRLDTSSPLIISEVLLASAEVPYQGKIQDVVEIYNRSDETVSTAGWYLSDGGDPYEYALPEGELAPGACMVLLCSRGAGAEYTGFSLGRNDVLRLTGPSYRYAQPISCDAAETGKSLLAVINGDELSYAAGEVSLGYENTRGNEQTYLQGTLPEGLRISELMSANMSYLKGAYATTCDWIELYNASEQSIDLSGYCLSKDSGDLNRYPLPEQTLGAGEYCVLLLSAKGLNLIRGYNVLPFNLSSDGETVYLSKGDTVVDFVLLPALPTDTSFGRANGRADFTTLASVTPGSANSAAAEMSAAPIALTPQGVYDDVERVTVELSAQGEIYYTTNATKPSSSSTLYTGPIELSKTTVIRAVSYEPGKQASEVLNLTYVINEYDELAVACLVAEPAQLFGDYSGIMVQGVNVGADDAFPYYNANYWWAVERRATVSLFETDGSGFSANCGISMFGGYSRALAKKSLAVFFRDCYGDSSLDYPLFGPEGLDSYESFVFRGCGQDSISAMMRDPMVSSLVASYTDVAVQKYKAVDLYINGQYWGIYYIREKINENYVAGNFNASKEDVTVCMANGRSSSEYVALIDYVRSHDLSDAECYEYMCSQVDIQQYMDYIIAEMWICNTDNGNIKFCKTTEGKWKWIMYDVDYSFHSYSFNTVFDHLNPDGTGAGNNFSTTLIRGLLENAEFKDAFLRRMAWQMDTIWNEETLIAWIDDFEDMIENDMVKDCKRWSRNYESWRRDVEFLRTFARNRNYYMLQHIQWQFDLTMQEMLDYGFHV